MDVNNRVHSRFEGQLRIWGQRNVVVYNGVKNIPTAAYTLQIYTVETGTPVKKCESYKYLP